MTVGPWSCPEFLQEPRLTDYLFKEFALICRSTIIAVPSRLTAVLRPVVAGAYLNWLSNLSFKFVLSRKQVLIFGYDFLKIFQSSVVTAVRVLFFLADFLIILFDLSYAKYFPFSSYTLKFNAAYLVSVWFITV